jgi:hypothetical protein
MKTPIIDTAIKILINNARLTFTPNISNEYLFFGGDTVYSEGVPNPNDLGVYTAPKAFFFDGDPTAAQRNEVSEEGKAQWTKMTFADRTGGNTNDAYNVRIPSNIYQALRILFDTGGTDYDEVLLKYEAKDNSNERNLPATNSGVNYNIWNQSTSVNTSTIDLNSQNGQFCLGSTSQSKTGHFESILYNTDFVNLWQGFSEGFTKKDFENLSNANRILPGDRYIRVRQGVSSSSDSQIDITFSYGTELIWYTPEGLGAEGKIYEDATQKPYIGARITLFTEAKQ